MTKKKTTSKKKTTVKKPVVKKPVVKKVEPPIISFDETKEVDKIEVETRVWNAQRRNYINRK